MIPSFDDLKGYGVGGIAVAFLYGAARSLRWWYSLRQVQRADDAGEKVRDTVAWMLADLRTEIDSLRMNARADRQTIVEQGRTMFEQAQEIAMLRARLEECVHARPYGN